MHSHGHHAHGVCGCVCVCRELYSKKSKAMYSNIKAKMVLFLHVLELWIFFCSVSFPLHFLCLTTMQPYEKGKTRVLEARVSAETLMCQGVAPLRLWVVRWEKCVLSLPLVVDIMPVWHVWAGNPVSRDRPQTLPSICWGEARVSPGMRINPEASRRGICGFPVGISRSQRLVI